MSQVEIITTAHGANDARLNRHKAYLEAIGIEVGITSFSTSGRPTAIVQAVMATARSNADAIILPDPELHALGAIAARLSGKRAVVDIHEDYRQVAHGRHWVPNGLAPAVGAIAALVIEAGRFAAHDVMVAAPQLEKHGDALVMNITPPGSVLPAPKIDPHKVVYVGDVTMARGAAEMADLAKALGEPFQLHVIGRVDNRCEQLLANPSLGDRVILHGPLHHDLAWKQAGDALVGLSLLRPLPAYRLAVATKIWEYMAAGIPPAVSNLPGQASVVSEVEPMLVVEDTAELVSLIKKLSGDPELRLELSSRAQNAYQAAWDVHRPDRALQSFFEP